MVKFLTKNYLVFVFLFIPSLLRAQNQSSISGKITDGTTGEPLIGVTVLVIGTSQGAISDVEGRYSIAHISQGKYTVLFKYLDYTSKSVTEVTVADNKTIVLNINMEKGATEKLSEVVVTSTYKQESVNVLYAAQKQSSVISDGISTGQISKSPDNNTADVLQRISGTSIQDNKFVVVRGLASRYNSTMMNGAAMPATEPDKKAFSFNVIPSNLVDNMVIYKTSSPEQPGDAAGGSIQINTKDLPDQKFMSLSIGTGFQTQTTFKNFYTGRGQGKYDFLSFNDGSQNLPNAFKQVQSRYASLNSNQKMEITRKFANTFGGEKAGESLPPLSLQLVLGNTKVLNNGNKIGFTAAIDYGNSRTTSAGTLDQYLLSKEQIYHYNDERYFKNYNTGALVGAAYIFGKNKISFKNFFSNEFQDVFTKRTGQVFDGSSNIANQFSINKETTQNGLLNSVLAGQHVVGGRSISIGWDVSYGLSYRMQPDQCILTVYQPDGGANYVLRLLNENSPAITNAGRVYSRLHENIYSGNIHFTVPFTFFDRDQKFKFGFSESYRDRSFSVQALGYASDLDPFGRGADINIDKNTTLSNIFSTDNLEKYKILLANIAQNTKDYTGTANVNAAYLMLENYFSSKWRLNWGLRLEDYRQQLLSINQPSQKYHYFDILPSANLIWSVTSKTNLRLAYSRTLNRPEFRELAMFRYYDYQNNFIISGNPSLKHSTNDNMDFRTEYYPGAGEILSASVFYKYFQNPIEQVNQGNNVLSYSNAEKAIDYGLELEARKRMDFLSAGSFFKSMILYANASFIKSTITFSGRSYQGSLQGQSPYMINGGLNYEPEHSTLSFSLLYNRIGPRLQFRGENDGLDTYEKARDVLDFQVSKKVFRQAGTLSISVADLLAQPVVMYYKYHHGAKSGYDSDSDKIISSFKPGTAISISFKYLFFHIE